MPMTTSSRWKVRVQTYADSARVVVEENDSPVGIVSLPLRSYHAACRDIIVEMTAMAQKVIEETLSHRLWVDAQTMTAGMDSEAAMAKMESFGWTKEKVAHYATEMALKLGQAFVEHLPRHQ